MAQIQDKRFKISSEFSTCDLVAASIHLTGGDRLAAGVFAGANVSLEPPADRQVVDVFIVPDRVISPLQRAQVELVASFGVTNPTVVTWRRTRSLDNDQTASVLILKHQRLHLSSLYLESS